MLRNRWIMLVLCALLPTLAHAGDRLYLSNVTCVAPPGAGQGHGTEGIVTGEVRFAQRTVTITGYCWQGYSHVDDVELFRADGEVQAMTATVTAVLWTTPNAWQIGGENTCTFETGNGFIEGRCLADEQLKGAVNFTLSIATPLP